jgi:peptidyl-prolyl cis-trans isomerase D
MATLEKIRSRGATILLIFIGLALFSFVFEGILSSGMTFFNQSKNNIITVDGESVTGPEYSEYNRTFTDINQIYNGAVLTPQQTEQIQIQSSFDNLLRQMLIENASEKIGISVSENELKDLLFGNNISPMISSSPLFVSQTTGTFDKNEVIRFAQSENEQEKNIWMFLENEVKLNQLINKYSLLLGNLLNANSLEAKFAFENNLVTADAAYVVQSYSSIADSLISVSDKELKDAYTQKKEQFKQEKNRDLQYISFPINPSQEDYAEIDAWVKRHMDEFITSEDVSELVSFESEIPLPTFYLSESNIDPDFREFAFSGKINDVSNTLFVNDTYKVARIVDTKMAPDSVNIRLISLITETPEKTEALADSIKTELKKGAEFTTLAVQFSQDPNVAMNRGEYGWLTEDMLGKELAEPIFNSNIGDIISVKSSFGNTFVIEVLGKSANVKKVKLAILARKVEPSKATYSKIYNDAKIFLTVNNTVEKFETAAREQGLVILPANVQESTVRIANIPSTRTIVQWALKENKPTVSSTIYESEKEYVIVALTGINEKGYKSLEDVKDILKAPIVQDKKGEMIADKMKGASSIEELSGKLSLPVNTLNGINFSNSRTAIGYEPAIVANVPFLKENELSNPIIGKSGVFVLSPLNISVSTAGFNEEEEKTNLNNFYSQSVYSYLFNILREKANVIDNRSTFY